METEKNTNSVNLSPAEIKYKLAVAYMQIIQNMPESFFIKDTDRESCIRRIKSYLMSCDKNLNSGRSGRVKSSIASL